MIFSELCIYISEMNLKPPNDLTFIFESLTLTFQDVRLTIEVIAEFGSLFVYFISVFWNWVLISPFFLFSKNISQKLFVLC